MTKWFCICNNHIFNLKNNFFTYISGVQVCRLPKRHHKSTECSIVKGKPLTILHAVQPTVTVQEPPVDPAVLSDEPASDDVGPPEPVSESDYVPSSHDSADTSTR